MKNPFSDLFDLIVAPLDLCGVFEKIEINLLDFRNRFFCLKFAVLE